MDLWWKIAGYVRIRITSADPARTLRVLSQKLRLEDIRWISDLTLEATVASRELEKAEAMIAANGSRIEILRRGGASWRLRGWAAHPILLGALVLLLAASMFLPSRILFIRVEGNDTVPRRLIEETAARCGVGFGASRSVLRSEQVKNRLLEELPQLSWVGVNTHGCVATIAVQEREPEQEQISASYGSIVAVRDAVVTGVTAQRGSVLCAAGQAVAAGQVLISGYSDLGICTRVEQPEGEIYGLTQREIDAVIPESTRYRGTEREITRRYSVIFGKKQINFDSNSGILDTTCGKMRMVYQLYLPGGWELPVWLVVETYEAYDMREAPRGKDAASALLNDSALRHTKYDMIAGEVLKSDLALDCGDGLYHLSGIYQCREMIGRRSSAVYLEGEEN